MRGIFSALKAHMPTNQRHYWEIFFLMRTSLHFSLSAKKEKSAMLAAIKTDDPEISIVDDDNFKKKMDAKVAAYVSEQHKEEGVSWKENEALKRNEHSSRLPKPAAVTYERALARTRRRHQRVRNRTMK